MASPTAIGGGALGAAAVGVGGAYLAGAFEGLGSSEAEKEPAIVLLSEDTTFSAENTNLIGKLYGKYLVAPLGSKGDGDSKTDNRKWWEQSYKRWKEASQPTNNDLSNEFKSSNQVSKAFSDNASEPDSSKALNKVCETIYKKENSEITFEDASNNKTKLKNDLFKYCSILGEVKTIGEVSGESYDPNTNYGGDSTNVKKFIAVTGNDKFWEIRNKEFYADSGDKSNSQASESSKFKSESKKTSKPNIRDICKAAYGSAKTNNTDYPDAEINKFCVL
ncbi:hypothetical protein [Candidatus Mycoplasma haematohominis]|uniref:hypothetical protein n=1 Tax=Candidatus Mycoplasma haematohominis TaxID=1494318 RepID=UPI001C0A730E|nr:hypothetical protein [Candidatus Mycoplasma haemohominis]